jgi:hypothetical protein
MQDQGEPSDYTGVLAERRDDDPSRPGQFGHCPLLDELPRRRQRQLVRQAETSPKKRQAGIEQVDEVGMPIPR